MAIKQEGVTKIIKKIRSLSSTALLKRYKQVYRAQSIRDYLSTKPEKHLNVELNLIEEEIEKRMSKKIVYQKIK